MSKLDDYAGKLSALVSAIERTHAAYTTAVAVYKQLESGEAVNYTGMGMNLQLGDLQLPLPLPSNQDTLLDYLHSSISFLAGELTQLWQAANKLTAEAFEYCAAKQAEAAQQLAAQPADSPQVTKPPLQPPRPQQLHPARSAGGTTPV